MTTKTVQISPEVELEEQAAMVGYLRNRSMIQAQAIAELKATVASQREVIAQLCSDGAPPVVPPGATPQTIELEEND